MKKFFCPFCPGTTCCIKSIKKHIRELHEELDHKAMWIYESK